MCPFAAYTLIGFSPQLLDSEVVQMPTAGGPFEPLSKSPVWISSTVPLTSTRSMMSLPSRLNARISESSAALLTDGPDVVGVAFVAVGVVFDPLQAAMPPHAASTSRTTRARFTIPLPSPPPVRDDTATVTPVRHHRAMNTVCPCGCGRRLPLDDHQIRHIAVHGRAAHELDLADKYGCAVSTIRHVREVWRSDGQLARPGVQPIT